jgi:hypothetical protein
MRFSLSMTITLISGLIILFAIPAMAQTEIPEEWFGIWEMDVASYDCDTDELLFSSTEMDTICPGSVFEDPDPGSFTIECTSSADATTYEIQCLGSTEVAPGCTVEFDYDGTGTLNSDTYTAVTYSNITYGAGCPVSLDTCQRVEITGTRVSSSTDDCLSTPVVSQAWGAIKSSYR